MSEANDSGSKRASMLGTMLGLSLLLFFSLFLVLITGGFFLHILGVCVVIGGLGAFHYYAWGKMLHDQTAGEREEFENQERATATEKPRKREFRR